MTASKAYRSLPSDSAVRVYLRIMAAAEQGVGVRLSPDEVWACSMDNAVEHAAVRFLEEQDLE